MIRTVTRFKIKTGHELVFLKHVCYFSSAESIPDPIHLNEVQSSLSKIQAILIQLKNFWENVAQMLDYLEQKTFVGEYLIEDLSELKEEFLVSIETAKEVQIIFT